ncbi:MAG: DUF3667 domain-containing protein [Proteobacteria bacterium]|nr:MAG: DUF3667 domain-containing protein [Pseudomonadota bacterium]
MKNCLNCGNILTENYCGGCGQKSDTHRISPKSFMMHDVLHGTFHVERGMFFTARQSLTRPGQAALDYIEGKRKRYYNVFYLVLITAGLMFFFWHLYQELDLSRSQANPDAAGFSSTPDSIKIFSKDNKISIFLFVPFAALNSYLLFRRKRLNIAEHSIIAGMVLLGILILTTIGNVLFFLDLLLPFSDAVANSISIATVILVFLHIGHSYYDAFVNSYTRFGIAIRIVCFFALIFLEIFIALAIKIGMATHWKFGTFSLALFG